MFQRIIKKINWLLYITNFWIIFAILWIIVLSFGYFGLSGYANSSNVSDTDHFYITSQLIFGNYPTNPIDEPFLLDFARFGAIILTFTTVLAALGVFLIQKIALAVRGVLGNHIIICGLGVIGTKFVEKYEQRDLPIIVIESNPDHPMIYELRKKGVHIIIGDATFLPTLKKAGITKAKHLIAATGSDKNNAIIGANCDELRKGIENEFICHIHIKNPQLCNLTQEICFQKHFSEISKVLIEPFNIYQFGGVLMLEDFPPFPESLSSNIPPHVLIIGGGKLGESVIQRLSILWQDLLYFIPGFKYQVTLIDLNAEELVDQIHLKYPPLEEVCLLGAQRLDVWSTDFLKMDFLFEKNLNSKFSAIYICLPDEETNIYAGLEIYNALRRPGAKHLFEKIPKIIVRTTYMKGYNQLLDQTMEYEEKEQMIDAFPLIDKTCSPDFIEYGYLCEIRARAIHEDYINLCLKGGKTEETKPRMKPFDKLDDERCRISNREQAKNQVNILKEIHCQIKYLNRWMPITPFIFSENEIELLSEMEHNRWWKMMKKFRKIPRPDGSEYPFRDTMIPYNELTDDWKEFDRNTIRNMPKVLSRVHMRIVRSNDPVNADHIDK